MKKILVLATTPFMNDGLTKIEMDVYRYNLSEMEIEFASSFGFDNEYGEELKKNETICNLLKPKKKVFSYMCSIYKLVSSRKYDAVYIHGNSAMMLLEALPARIAGCKEIITHCHNTKSKFPPIHYLFKPFLNVIVAKKIACSSLAAKWAYMGKRQYVVLNGIDIDKFKYNDSTREEIRNELEIEDSYLVGHVGRFNFQKNHNKIIDVFNDCLKIEPKTKLLLIGEGELKETIIEKVEENGLSDKVVFLGSTNRVEDYMQAMDCFLFPSLFEGLGIVAIEAQANGLPIVLSDVCPGEVKISDNCQMLSLKDSDEKWAKAVIRAMKNGHIGGFGNTDMNKWSHKKMMEKLRKIIKK